jgi:hypothetical protein
MFRTFHHQREEHQAVSGLKVAFHRLNDKGQLASGEKSEIQISKLETSSKSKTQMSKPF